MQHAAFSGDKENFRRMRFAEMDHFFGGTNFVRQHAHCFGAFWMRVQRRARVLLPKLHQGIVRPLDVHVTEAAPERHRTAGLLHYPRAQIFVWHKE